MATNLYSLLIQMDLSSSICDKMADGKWQNIAPFSKRIKPCVVEQPTCLEWPRIRCFSFTAFICQFLSFDLFSIGWTIFGIIL